MTFRFKQCKTCPCEADIFTINGFMADIDDFGCNEDFRYTNISHNDDDEDILLYGCMDHHFIPIDPTPEVLNKYKITEEEYSEVCDILCDKLRIGKCGWCV